MGLWAKCIAKNTIYTAFDVFLGCGMASLMTRSQITIYLKKTQISNANKSSKIALRHDDSCSKFS